MKIVGFNFTKLNSEKKKNKIDNFKIDTEIKIKEIKEIKQDYFQLKETILEANFCYKVEYFPDIALIEVEGNVLVSLEKKEAEELLKNWKKESKSDESKIIILNAILKKATLKVLQMEEEINLPLHIPFPSFKKTDK